MSTVAKRNSSQSEPHSPSPKSPRRTAKPGKDVIAIIDNLFRALPLIHRKLLKVDLEGTGISRLHMPVMGMLCESGALPVSEVGRRLFISKPQMTHLVDRLISLGLVARQPDEHDRRVINIALTSRGERTLKTLKKSAGEGLGKRLSVLDTEELKELAACLDGLVRIATKLE